MVHIGAMIAAIFSCGSCWPGAGKLLELRLPQPQREWIGMGAAAGRSGVQRAVGGILYSFEEVCPHWTHTLTWRSFFCCMLVSMFYAMLVEYSDGEVPSGIATGIKLQHKKLWSSGAFVWVILVGAIGGAVGAMYNKVVEFMNLSRKSMYDFFSTSSSPMGRSRRRRKHWARGASSAGTAPLPSQPSLGAVDRRPRR